MPWMTQAIIDPAHDFVKLTNPLIDKELAPLLNIAGISAYHAVVNHCKPKAGELVVVSSCAGAVGSIAGQLLTQAGARVIGICGSKQKGQWAKSIGAVDVALCYRDNDFEQQLEDACSAKVNLYLDNVGGEISNAVIMQLAPQARVVVCGQISTYNQDTTSKDYVYPDPLPENVATFLETQNATRERFFVGWHAENNDRAYADLHALMSSGKLHVPITWIEGLPSAPQAFCDMMQGKHKGKVMVKLLST
uniref:Alcohol dehydrogenase-like C-terminal domain-containing protein n=2 Tax=Mucochytrium quahogii TaxID=96639 RepID=A0A7S2SRR1_9STRA|mmetsp:Transcript_23090/g.36775  ORF Transcript_23090/g.36775 Transcript_23090/m.36775 type:complete len:249 (-) Transcript_23090:1255-2001(-)